MNSKNTREEIDLEELRRTPIYGEGDKIVIEPFPGDSLKTLDKIIRGPYDEAKEEKTVGFSFKFLT